MPLEEGRMHRFVAALLRAEGETVDGLDIRFSVWGDHPPAALKNNLRVIACTARQKLRPHGLRIYGVRGRGYVLHRIGSRSANG